MKLYRPVGLKELELILADNAKTYPPRLAWQPIFYPVLNFEYARQIATRWNLDDELSGYAGFVTEFDIDDAYVAKFEVQNVGGHLHNELWVPAAELAEFNDQIIGKIQVSAAFYGEKYTGKLKQVQALAGLDAHQQLEHMSTLTQDRAAIAQIIDTDAASILVNFAYWQQANPQAEVLPLIQQVWQEVLPQQMLCVQ